MKVEKWLSWILLSDVTLEYHPTCESCIEGKMTKRDHSSYVLEQVDTNVYGAMNIIGRGGCHY